MFVPIRRMVGFDHEKIRYRERERGRHGERDRRKRENWTQMSSVLGMTDDLYVDSSSGQGRQNVNQKEVLNLTHVSHSLENHRI